MASLSWSESSEDDGSYITFEPVGGSAWSDDSQRRDNDDGDDGTMVVYESEERGVVPYNPDDQEGTVIAYEPVRTVAARRRNNNRLRICKAKLTLSFSVYIVTGGTLLTMGTFLLSGILFVIGFLALGFSAFIAAAWLFFNKAFSLVSAASHRLTPKPLLNSPREHSLQHVD